MPVGPTPEDLIIRTMQREDLDFVVNLSQKLGWTPTRTDIEIYWSLEPEGCFVAELQGEVIGSVTTTPYNHFSWLGMMLVHPDWHRRRIGSTLMQFAIRYLKEKGIMTIRLEADPPGIPLYDHLNFLKESDSGRWYRKGLVPTSVGGVRQATKADLIKIHPLDVKAFGDDRKRVFEQLLDYAEFALVLENSPESGILMARQTSHGIAFGPFIAQTLEIAEHLLIEGLNRASNATVLVGVPSTHRNAISLLQRYSFIERSVLNRMYFGKPPKRGDSRLEYGIATSATG